MSGPAALVLGTLGTLVCACSSGGGGGSKPLTIGFESAGSDAVEGVTASVTLVLKAKNGPLTEDVSVTVRDAGSGTSTAGADHDFTADRIVTFPNGSVDGATLTVDVALVSDLSIEGEDESLRLTLVDVTKGGYGKRRNHTLDIEEADFAELAFVVTTSATADETTPSMVEVELGLDPGESLDVDVQATVEDDRSGTATRGVDYVSFADQTLTFPNGSPDGTRLSVMLEPIGDVDAEGDETAQLVLTDPSAGAQLGSASHMVTITDDDLSTNPFLLVTGVLFGGPASTVSHLDSFDLGTESLDSGPNQALELTIQNAGALPYDLAPLRITGNTRDFSVDLNHPGGMPLPQVPTPAAFPFAVVQDDAVHGACLDFDAALCSVLEDASTVVMDGVVLPGGAGEVTLELERLPLPFTHDAVVQVDGTARPVADVVGDLSLWKGHVPGLAESAAFLALSSSGSQGWVQLGEGFGTLHMVTEFEAGEPTVHWLWDTQLEGAYTGDQPGACGEMLVPPGTILETTLPGAPSTSEMTVGLTLPDCRLAIETDYQFYSIFNDTTAATQYVTGLIAAVSEVYERDVQTALSIAYLGIHSNPNDGWTTPDTGGHGATGDLLDEFQAAWSGNWPASADLAHFISGANLGGGVAYVDVLCSQGFGFGVSASVNGNIDWGSFTGAPSVSNWDFIVVAHELGHNFGALHTHDYCAPLDPCSANCNGTSGCPQGTIMSYCHLCGGIGNLRLDFHPHVAEQMRSNVNSSCLADATLAPGTSVSVTVSFEPTSSTGNKSGSLRLTHTAPNEPSPFRMNLSGSATN